MSECPTLYRKRANEMRRASAEAGLSAVRDRFDTAARRWDELAEQGESVARARAAGKARA